MPRPFAYRTDSGAMEVSLKSWPLAIRVYAVRATRRSRAGRALAGAASGKDQNRERGERPERLAHG